MLLLELTKRLQNSDPQVKYVLTYLYEMFNEQQKQLNMLSNIAQMLAEHDEMIIERLSLRQTDVINRAQAGHSGLDAALEQLNSFGKPSGVEVSSVANDPEKEDG